jgi:copper(I)-binding protein
MRIGLLSAALLLFFAVAGTAVAHEYKVKELTIGHPWARATPGGVKNGVVYLTFVNDGKTADRLLKASTPIAAGVMLHTNIKEGDIVRMRDVDAVEIPAGKTVELKPGGLHIMLMGLTQPLKDGDMFPMTLTLADAGEVKIEVMVSAQ